MPGERCSGVCFSDQGHELVTQGALFEAVGGSRMLEEVPGGSRRSREGILAYSCSEIDTFEVGVCRNNPL